MKKAFLWMMAVALLASCAKEKDTNVVAPNGGKTYTITANINNPETRTTAERFQDANTGAYKYAFSWEPGEQISVVPTDYTESLVFDLVDANTGTFSYTPMGGEAPNDYSNGFSMAVSPAEALISLTPSVTNYDIYFHGSYLYGHSNAILVAGEPTPGPDGTQKFQFEHIAALVKVTYKNVPAGTMAMVFEADHNIKGTFHFTSVENVVASNTSFSEVEEDAPTEAIVMFDDVLDSPMSNAEFFLPIPTGSYQTFQVHLVGEDMTTPIPGTEQSWTAANPFTLNCADVVACPEVEVVTPVSVVENFSSSAASNNQYNCSSSLATANNRKDFDFTWTPSGAGTVFQSGIKLGNSNGTGSVTSSDILASIPVGSNFTVNVYAAVYNTDGGELVVSYNGNSIQQEPSNDAITNTSSTYSESNFTSPTSFVFTKTAEAEDLTIASSQLRIFIDKVEIVPGGTIVPVEKLTVTPSLENPETVSYEGGVMTYSVTAEMIDSWDAESSDEDFVITKNNDGFVVTVAENETSMPRSATITVTGGTLTVSVTINQEAAPVEIEALTIAQFLAKEAGDTYYQLTGKLTNLQNSTYGNFTLVDETGSVYVYGLTKTQKSTNDQSFSSIGVGEGDIVTLVGKRAEYNNNPQVGGPAYYVSHIPAPEISVNPTTKTVLASVTSIEISITSNADWTITGEGITATPSSGNGNGTATLTFAARTASGDAQLVATVKADIDPTVYETVTITQHGTDYVAPTGWVETDLADIEEGDVFVIVGNNGSNYAMSNNNGTGSAPSAVAVTVNDGKITSTVSNNIKWHLTAESGSFVFYPNGVTNAWLYTTTSNNGLRVGTSQYKNIELNSNGYLTIFDGDDTRYIGVYTSSDWRSYTSVNNNIKNQTFKFYKLFGEDPGGDDPSYTVAFSQPASGGTISVKVNGSDITSGASFESGTTVTIKATPAANYVFSSWTISGATLTNASLAETSFQIGNSDVTISATFTSQGGDVLTIDFENETYSDWEFTNIVPKHKDSGVAAHGGTYFGDTDGKTSGSIITKNKISDPKSLTFYISKLTTNTNATSVWKVSVSSDGTVWSQVGDDQAAASGITKGTWYEVSRDLRSYHNVYVKIEYSGTSAKRCIDDVSLSY